MKVFISHAQADKLLARKLAAGLRQAGLDVFDEDQILAGENWAARIAKELGESGAMVVLLTPAALGSGYVQREIEYALGQKSYKGRLIPVLVGSPDELPAERLPWILRQLQTFILPKRGNSDKSIKQIAKALLDAA
jgi:hypothetical protein